MVWRSSMNSGERSGRLPVSITEVMVSCAPFRRWEELSPSGWQAVRCCIDLEALCWERGAGAGPAAFPASARPQMHGVVALWPGRITECIATFSALGPERLRACRLDRTSAVLRAAPTRFPDEVPFEIERIP